MATFLVACGNKQYADDALPVQHFDEFQIPTTLGAGLAARHYPLPHPPSPPGIILIHDYASSQDIWEPMAQKLQNSGFAVLSFDLRGHGKSADASMGKPATFKLHDWLGMLNDIALAKGELIQRGASPERIAIMGEELGASLALLAAVNDPDIAALVMLSPALKMKGVEIEGLVGRLQDRPLLILCTENDAYAQSSAKVLHQEAPGFVELRSYPGASSGAEMLSLSPTALGETMDWLKQHFAGAQ